MIMITVANLSAKPILVSRYPGLYDELLSPPRRSAEPYGPRYDSDPRFINTLLTLPSGSNLPHGIYANVKLITNFLNGHFVTNFLKASVG